MLIYIYIYIFKDNIDKKTWGMGTEGVRKQDLQH